LHWLGKPKAGVIVRIDAFAGQFGELSLAIVRGVVCPRHIRGGRVGSVTAGGQ